MTKHEAVAWAAELTWCVAVRWYMNDLAGYEFFRLWAEDFVTHS